MPQDQLTSLTDPPRWKSALGIGWLVLFVGCFFCLPIVSGNVPRWDALLNYDIYFPYLFQPVVTPAGWQYLTQRLEFVLVAALILASSFALGQLLLDRLLTGGQAFGIERSIYAIGLGLSAWSLITLTLGLLGLILRWLFVVLLATPIIVASIRARLKRLRSLSTANNKGTYKKEGGEKRTVNKRPAIVDSVWNHAPWRMEIYLAILFPFVCWMVLGAMLPSTDFDVKEYHLQGPKEWLQAGQIQFLPHNVYTSFPFMTEMLSLLAMVVHGDWYWGALAGKTVLMAFAPLTALALFAAGRRLFSTQAGFWAALVYLTTPWTFRISTIALVEGGLSFYLAVALLTTIAVVFHLRDGRNSVRPLVFLTGLFAGTAMACKYPGVISVVFPLGLFIACILWQITPSAKRGKTIASHALIYTLGVVLAVGPWLLKNLMETGNPVYPLLYSLFGGVDWDNALNAKWKGGHGVPNFNLFKMATYWVLDLTAAHFWLSPLLYGLAPLALLKREGRKRAASLWLYVAVLFLTWWALTHRLDRFWVPMLPVVALLAGAGATTFGSRSGRVVLRVVLFVSLLFNALMIFSGQSGYNAFLADLNVSRQRVTAEYQPGLYYLNQTMTDEHRVLMVGEAQVFDAEFPLVYNTVFDRSIFQQLFAVADAQAEDAESYRLKSAEEIRQTLADEGITHLYVNWAEVLRYRTTYGFTHFVEPARFTELVELGLLRPVKQFASLLAAPDTNQSQLFAGQVASLSDGRPVQFTGYRNFFSTSEQGQLDKWGQPLLGELRDGSTPAWVNAAIYEVVAGD